MDREEVIKGLECCDALHNGGVVMCGTECPYGIADGIDRGCRGKLIPDALALLKAQEPVEPKMMEFVDEGLTWEKYEVPTCGVCGALLGDALFCPMCGRVVKWDG